MKFLPVIASILAAASVALATPIEDASMANKLAKREALNTYHGVCIYNLMRSFYFTDLFQVCTTQKNGPGTCKFTTGGKTVTKPCGVNYKVRAKLQKAARKQKLNFRILVQV